METPSQRIKRAWITRKKNNNDVPYNKLPIPDKKKLELKYLIERKSTWTISQEYKVSQTQILRWLKYHDINTRDYRENPCPTKGKHLSRKHRKKISEALKKNKNGGKGKTHWNWQGGKTPKVRKLRSSERYKRWRMTVFKRDNWTCVECGGNKYVEADHIKPFSKFPKLRFKVKNGRTLCKKCHKKIGWQLFKDENPKTL